MPLPRAWRKSLRDRYWFSCVRLPCVHQTDSEIDNHNTECLHGTPTHCCMLLDICQNRRRGPFCAHDRSHATPRHVTATPRDLAVYRKQQVALPERRVAADVLQWRRRHAGQRDRHHGAATSRTLFHRDVTDDYEYVLISFRGAAHCVAMILRD